MRMHWEWLVGIWNGIQEVGEGPDVSGPHGTAVSRDSGSFRIGKAPSGSRIRGTTAVWFEVNPLPSTIDCTRASQFPWKGIASHQAQLGSSSTAGVERRVVASRVMMGRPSAAVAAVWRTRERAANLSLALWEISLASVWVRAIWVLLSREMVRLYVKVALSRPAVRITNGGDHRTPGNKQYV